MFFSNFPSCRGPQTKAPDSEVDESADEKGLDGEVADIFDEAWSLQPQFCWCIAVFGHRMNGNPTSLSKMIWMLKILLGGCVICIPKWRRYCESNFIRKFNCFILFYVVYLDTHLFVL